MVGKMKEENKSRVKIERGITLIALIVTIVVLLILSGVSISLVTGENGLIEKAKEGKAKYKEGEQNDILALDGILEEIDNSAPTVEGYNENKKVNRPKLSKGMIPVKWDSQQNNWVVCSETDLDWYSYDGKKKLWANVMLSDGKYKAETVKEKQVVKEEELGSMYVWIPRYAYMIKGEKDIEVVFLKGNTDEGVDGKKYSEDESKDTKQEAIVHPAFKFGDGNLTGIWVAKFESSGTNGNGEAVGNVASVSVGTAVAPDAATVVKSLPNKISWRHITIGDSQTRCIQIATTNKDKYGIEKVSSHLIKNSEWGAVAYLCYSSYGSVPQINAAGSSVSGEYWYNMYTGAGPLADGRTDWYGIEDGEVVNEEYTKEKHGYSTDNGILATTTGNITGIYDMNGGAWERVAAYLDNSNTNLSNFAGQYFDKTTNELKPEYAALWDKYDVSEEEKKAAKTAAIEIEDNGTKTYLTQSELWDPNKIDLKYQIARLRLTKAIFDNMAKHKGIGVNEVSTEFSFYAPYYTKYSETENETSWSGFKDPNNAAAKPGITKGGFATTWDNDYVLIGHASYPFVIRGGCFRSWNAAGVFYSQISGGGVGHNHGFRSVLVL